MNDCTQAWRETIRAAAAAKTPLRFRGAGTKDFYGRNAQHDAATGSMIDTRPHAGVVAYEPTELVVTVRSGTPLAELEQLLAAQGQMLPFEPPGFGGATVGGCVAAGLAGPRRQAAGGVRDFMLGVRIIDGRGDVLSFGGQVMKNVAGYDVSRLMAGSLGTLGLLLELSLKVLPKPVRETSLRFAMTETEAIDRLNEWGGQPLPLSASIWQSGELLIRLSGAEAAVKSAMDKMGGEPLADDVALARWHAVREQTLPFFTADGPPLWRIAVPSTAEAIGLAGEQVVEWGGGLRWLRSDEVAERIRVRVAALGGHATLYRGGDRDGDVFHPQPSASMAIHRRLKQAFDPEGIFNPGRLYQEF